MQQAIPYKSWAPPPSTSTSASATTDSGDSQPPPPSKITNNPKSAVQKLVAENSVIVFGRRGCCMCHVVKRLLLGLGANPSVVEVDEGEEAAVIRELAGISAGGGIGGQVVFPAVFVGGKLFGGLERVMATHISGELVPILKDAGALWL